MRTYHEGRRTTPTRGTFYLAGSRNFLFGSNTVARAVLKKPFVGKASKKID
jgi:hypothetical protein